MELDFLCEFITFLKTAPNLKDLKLSQSCLFSAGILDDPMISTYSRSMTSDPLMTSSILGGCLGGPAPLGGPASALEKLSSSPPKKYGVGSGGSDEWSDATWLNNLRISAGMEPIPMPNSTSVASKVGCFKN